MLNRLSRCCHLMMSDFQHLTTKDPKAKCTLFCPRIPWAAAHHSYIMGLRWHTPGGLCSGPWMLVPEVMFYHFSDSFPCRVLLGANFRCAGLTFPGCMEIWSLWYQDFLAFFLNNVQPCRKFLITVSGFVPNIYTAWSWLLFSMMSAVRLISFIFQHSLTLPTQP